MKIIVTGGCGYIGSHTIVSLVESGYEVVSIDSLIRSKRTQLEGVERIVNQKIRNYTVDVCDAAALRGVFEAEGDINGIIHFAALKSVAESVHEPGLYYRNNIEGLLNVLDCCVAYNVPNFIFSSSCSVYGNTDALPVTEATPLQKAESPYGHTKQIGEDIIAHYTKIHPKLNAAILRYFNPAGAHPSGCIGEESWAKPIYLTPVIMAVAKGDIPSLTVFGDDYPTRDGSCVRDFIHVMDLAKAHTQSLRFLNKKENTANYTVFNLGIGNGVTVLEAIKAYEAVSGKPLNYTIGSRRAGDLVAIYADYTKAADLLQWQPQYNIEDIMRSAVRYEEQRTQTPQ